MEAKDKARYLFDLVDEIVCGDICWQAQKAMAIMCVENEYKGIIYVLGELKSRGELSEKMYLKCVHDLILESENIQSEIELL